MARAEVGPDHPFRSAEARVRYLERYAAREQQWPIAADARLVSTSVGETLVRSCGPEAGSQLVMLAGAWAHSMSWSPELVSALAEECRVHCVDTIADFGRSASVGPVTETAQFMRWLDELLDDVSPTEPVHLLGVSRGAWLAAEYALHAPQRLASVSWVSPGLVVSGPSMRNALGGLSSLRAMLRPTQRNVAAMLHGLMPDLAAADPQGFSRFASDAALGLQCFDTRLVGRVTGARVLSDSELQAMDIPVLCMIGAQEKLISARAAETRLRAVAPRIEVEVVPEAAHGLDGSRPSLVSRRVLSVIRQG